MKEKKSKKSFQDRQLIGDFGISKRQVVQISCGREKLQVA